MPSVGITALSVAGNAKSAEQLNGTDLAFASFDGQLEIYAKCSATGLNILLTAGGDTVLNDTPIPYTGAAGSLSTNDNLVDRIFVSEGSVLRLSFRNTTGVAITVDTLIRLVPV